MTITAVILAHYKERTDNLKRVVDSLLRGRVVPDEVVVFIDNPEITFSDDRVTVIASYKSLLPRIRFSLGSYFTTDYCFFIDDDLAVREETLYNLIQASYSLKDDTAILGLQGSILGHTDNPYADDTSIKRENRKGALVEVDVVLRTYFVPKKSLVWGTVLYNSHPGLPEKSLDDVYLCLGNKYLNHGRNYVVSVDEKSDVSELDEAGVGQSHSGEHYANRNRVCKYLMDEYVISSTNPTT